MFIKQVGTWTASSAEKPIANKVCPILLRVKKGSLQCP